MFSSKNIGTSSKYNLPSEALLLLDFWSWQNIIIIINELNDLEEPMARTTGGGAFEFICLYYMALNKMKWLKFI